MPDRYIEIPEPVRLADPTTKEVIEGDDGLFSFETLLQKVSDNPKWNTTYKLGRTMDAIWNAWESMPKLGGASARVLRLAEEDWKELEEAVQNPKALIISQNGPQAVPGFGLHPRLVRQILPICAAVVEAGTINPEEKAAPEAKAG